MKKSKSSLERLEKVTFRLTSDELIELREAAHAAHMSVSHIVRRRVLGHPPPPSAAPAVNIQLKSELGRQGVNLNQISAHINKAKDVDRETLAKLAQYIKDTTELLKKVQAQLVGISEKSK